MTFKIKKNQKPRIVLCIPSWSWGQAYLAALIHPWTQLISAFYLRSRFSRCFWRWMEIFSWTWVLSSLCHNNNRWVQGCLLFLKFGSFLQQESSKSGDVQDLQIVYGRFTVIFSHFLQIMWISFKNEVGTILLRCLLSLNLNWFKSYGKKVQIVSCF